MPELKCSVSNCKHNQQMYCAKDTIKVDGESAKNASGTCCSSFEERKDDSYSNMAKSASPTSNIDCKACNCDYNEDCSCHAGKISVEGNGACDCGQTECASFSCCK
ncbi:DUF1540 domain-containing protein [Lachnospiraceae bacterium LCP25S3_G4]